MGLLVNGKWKDQWYETKKSRGAFVREDSKFHRWITPNGEPGPGERPAFPAAPDRYHLYVSYACPWAHRTLIFRKLKKLENIIGVSVTKPEMLENGWEYPPKSSATGEEVNGFRYHYQLYTTADPDYTGRVTVPVLWDKVNRTIINNESAEIIRIFNSSFSAYTDVRTDYYPAELSDEIDRINAEVYENVNNGVYRCGFATSQKAYEEAFKALFATLDKLEARLERRRYLIGDRITEADWRLFTTLVRFDVVYYGHFKANLRRISDFPNLSNYLRDLYQQPGIADTVHFDHIKRHYYYSHASVNPTRIVPLGPELDLNAPHNREGLS